MPKSEVILWQELRGKKLRGYKFRRQYGIGLYMLDFYCPNKKLGIEIDGDSHFREEAKEQDKIRQQFIESKGVKIMRFTNNDVQGSLDGVVEKIIENLTTSPDPSLEKRGDTHKYLKYKTQIITDFSNENINTQYSVGYVMGRPEKGYMDQTRSLRIDLSKFETTSENRRVLRKVETLKFDLPAEMSSTQARSQKLPIPKENYDWRIHKIGKDFYTTKFGDSTFSANKIKELLTTEHNFTHLFVYSRDGKDIGYSICVVTDSIVHYSYPFYKLDIDTKNLGMGMMLKAIMWAKGNGKDYIYLGALQRETDKYKLQFKGMEVWEQKDSQWEPLEV